MTEDLREKRSVWGTSRLVYLIFSIAFIFTAFLADTRSVAAAPIATPGTFALPAFARKYSMPCSACHDSWPRLSPFGQAFKDNGYQLMNEKDAPIWQNPGYWPVTFRITPFWHLERTNRVQVDGTSGPNASETGITTHGFDWSGLDFHTAGTLAKNVSFYVLPSSDSTGAFHFESVWARLDNMFGSSWMNVKVGKFELDNLQSEKRILTLSSVGGLYQNYHFQPLVSPGSSAAPGTVGESVYGFGIGDNQVGIEWLGHSKDDRTRVSVSLLSSLDGSPGLTSNNGGGVAMGGPVTAKTYDGFIAASQAFQVGDLGLQRVGGFAYLGQAPTYCRFTSAGLCVDGTGAGTKPFYRAGFIGMWFIKKFDVTTMYFRGFDNAALTEAAPGVGPIAGARNPTWNGALIEPHYTVSPRLVFTGRYEAIRMSQQVLATNPGNFGNIDAGVIGYRFYPFISSRAGFAFHNEFAIVRQRGAAPVTGLDLTTGSVLLGLDFDF